MTRLSLRYSIRQQTLEGLYDIIDERGTYYGEPAPYDKALKLMRVEQDFISARELEDMAVIGLMGGC